MIDSGSDREHSKSQLLRALASATRRTALRELRDAPRRSLDELAGAVANDTHTGLTTPERRK